MLMPLQRFPFAGLFCCPHIFVDDAAVWFFYLHDSATLNVFTAFITNSYSRGPLGYAFSVVVVIIIMGAFDTNAVF